MFNIFKSAKRRRAEELEKKAQQKIACRQALRQMEKCEASLTKTLNSCKNNIIECELSGRRRDALRQVRCYCSVEKMRNKVAAMRTRIQMIMEMQEVSNVMAKFMKDCAGMTGVIEGLINPDKLFASQAEMEKTMIQMDRILDRTDLLFDGIGSGDDYCASAEDEAELDALLYEVKGAEQIREIDDLNRQLKNRSNARS